MVTLVLLSVVAENGDFPRSRLFLCPQYGENVIKRYGYTLYSTTH